MSARVIQPKMSVPFSMPIPSFLRASIPMGSMSALIRSQAQFTMSNPSKQNMQNMQMALITKILCQINQMAKPRVANDIYCTPRRIRFESFPPVAPTIAVVVNMVKRTRHIKELGKPNIELCHACSTELQLKTLLRLHANTASLFSSNVIFSTVCKKAESIPMLPPTAMMRYLNVCSIC